MAQTLQSSEGNSVIQHGDLSNHTNIGDIQKDIELACILCLSTMAYIVKYFIGDIARNDQITTESQPRFSSQWFKYSNFTHCLSHTEHEIALLSAVLAGNRKDLTWKGAIYSHSRKRMGTYKVS